MNALILVDIQNDFLPGGALAVRNGDEVIDVANTMQKRFELVVATQDWHPREHQSFASSHRGRRIGEVVDLHGLPQVLWPDHCIQNTQGANFPHHLLMSRVERVFQKGTDPTIDSYSGFFDNGHRKSTGLADFLRDKNVREVTIIGLSTDYCVKATALDAKNLGFATRVVPSGCRGVELYKGDVTKAYDEMRAAGVRVEEMPDEAS